MAIHGSALAPRAASTDAAGGDLLEEEPTADGGRAGGRPAAEGSTGLPAPSYRVGAVLQARYELLSVLGQGAFSTVYKAQRLATGEDVAIKIPRLQREGPSSEQRYARFHREISLCARLAHPNIVRVIEAGETGEGMAFSVFDYLPGEDLATVLKKSGALAPEEAIHLMVQVLEALCCAHAADVVHRDIKPANIMVVPADARRDAVVIDFGISALVPVVGATSRRRRASAADSAVLGTPGYGAPEQFEGGAPSPRSDLYAWGLVFIECLTGEPVFAGGSLRELLLKQGELDVVPTPPALAGHPLGAILRRVTEKHVEAREVTAEEVLREIEGHELDGPTRAALVGARAGL